MLQRNFCRSAIREQPKNTIGKPSAIYSFCFGLSWFQTVKWTTIPLHFLLASLSLLWTNGEPHQISNIDPLALKNFSSVWSKCPMRHDILRESNLQFSNLESVQKNSILVAILASSKCNVVKVLCITNNRLVANGMPPRNFLAPV